MSTIDKYKRFIHDLVELTGSLHYVQVPQVSNDLIYAIENDCIHWTSVSKLFTQDEFHSVIDKAKVMYKSLVSNKLSNVMRWCDNINKYQTIYVDLQDVPVEHRHVIIDDLPLSLYSYGDECSMTVYKNDNVRIHMKYANDTNLIADDNKLFIKISITQWPSILVQSVEYMLSLRIQDSKDQKSVYEVFPIGKDLHIASDWFSNDKLRIHIYKLEQDKPDLDKNEITESETSEHRTIVFDDAYYKRYILRT